MPKLNENYLNLKASYLFSEIAHRTAAYKEQNPEEGAKIIRLGIGDVTLPLGKVVIDALHQGVEAMASAETFKGYGPEQGYQEMPLPLTIRETVLMWMPEISLCQTEPRVIPEILLICSDTTMWYWFRILFIRSM